MRSRTYTGDFDWDGTTYRGTHLPLVSHQLWSLVQDRLTGRGVSRRRRATHDFAFSRLITCGHCGCALVGDRKKQRYTYYHCTGYRGKCPEPYTREETLEAHFTLLLRRLSVDATLVAWMGEVLRSTAGKDRDDHQQAIRRLEHECARLEHRLEQMYVDKLDGQISAAFFDRKSESWRGEREQILATIAGHRDGTRTAIYIKGWPVRPTVLMWTTRPRGRVCVAGVRFPNGGWLGVRWIQMGRALVLAGKPIYARDTNVARNHYPS